MSKLPCLTATSMVPGAKRTLRNDTHLSSFRPSVLSTEAPVSQVLSTRNNVLNDLRCSAWPSHSISGAWWVEEGMNH